MDVTTVDVDIEVRPRVIFHDPLYTFLEPERSRRHFYGYVVSQRYEFFKYQKNKNMTKYFRKQGKLKQPGGSSCNQRR
jgi:hypothetical protein